MVVSSGRSTDSYRAFPGWSLIGIVAGTLAATVAIPEFELAAMGSLRVSGIALSLGLLLGVVTAGFRSPAALFRAEHLLMFGLVYWVVLDAVQGGYELEGASREALVGSMASIGLFAAFLWIGSVLTWLIIPLHPPARLPINDLGPRFLFCAGIVCFVLGGMRVWVGCSLSPACIADSFDVSRAGRAAWMPEGGIGNWDTVLQNLRYFGYLTLPFAVALHRLQRRFGWPVLLLISFGLINLILSTAGGNRRSTGTIVGATALTWILLHPKISLRHLLILSGVAAALLLFLQAVVLWRHSGFERSFEAGKPIFSEERPGIIVDRNLYWLGQVLTMVPDYHPYIGSTGIVAIVSAPIPRSLFPSKPINRGIDLVTFTGQQGNKGFTWTCSAVGDLYLIGGYAAIIIGGLVYGLLANLCSRLLWWPSRLTGRLLFAVSAMALFVGLRDLSEIVLTGVAFLCLWGLFFAREKLLPRGRSSPAPVGSSESSQAC
ncbi:MAG: O-antigen polymerase [Pseudomonadota bacterium]